VLSISAVQPQLPSAGLTVTGDGTNSITASGTLTDLNTALNGLLYSPGANYNGPDTLSIGVNDNGNSGTGGPLSDSKSVAITVNAVDDPPVAVADNVWPAAQYATCLSSGIEDAYRAILPTALVATQDHVFPASCSVARGTASLGIRSSGAAANAVWLAPAGTTTFTAGSTMTKAAGTATSIAVPANAGTYKVHVLDAQGNKLGESSALLRVN